METVNYDWQYAYGYDLELYCRIKDGEDFKFCKSKFRFKFMENK